MIDAQAIEVFRRFVETNDVETVIDVLTERGYFTREQAEQWYNDAIYRKSLLENPPNAPKPPTQPIWGNT